MIATIDYIERKFSEFNHMIFEDKLKPLPFKLSCARTFLGQLRYRRKQGFWGKCKYDNFQLVISGRRDMAESLLEDTIIHEMIHYYILSNQLTDTSSHGKLFRQMMNDINARFKRSITISHRSSDEEWSDNTEIRKHYLCISQLKDDRRTITVVAKTRLLSLWDTPSKCPDIVNYKWYVSTNPFFNRYRRSLTLKLYLITPEQLATHLRDAQVLVREGSVIHSIFEEWHI